MSCPVIRTRFAALRTLPSSTYRTPSSRPTSFTSTARPLYVKLELRAITNSQRMRDKAVMMSSATPSVKYSCSMSPLRFRKGSAAIEGPSGRAGASPMALAGAWVSVLTTSERVADGLARRVDVTAQGRFRDDPPGPHGIQDLVLTDDVL